MKPVGRVGLVLVMVVAALVVGGGVALAAVKYGSDDNDDIGHYCYEFIFDTGNDVFYGGSGNDDDFGREAVGCALVALHGTGEGVGLGQDHVLHVVRVPPSRFVPHTACFTATDPLDGTRHARRSPWHPQR